MGGTAAHLAAEASGPHVASVNSNAAKQQHVAKKVEWPAHARAVGARNDAPIHDIRRHFNGLRSDQSEV